MSLGPKVEPRPLVLYVDDANVPRSFGEASSISVSSMKVDSLSAFSGSSITVLSRLNAGTISATSYLGAAVGGVSRITELDDVNIPTFDSLNGYLLLISSVGVSSNVVALPSSTFSTQGGETYFSALLDTPNTYNNGQIVVYTATGLSSIASSVFALVTTLANYIPISVSATFALSASLSGYIPISVSSTFAQTTSLNSYIPTSVSSTFAQVTSLEAHESSSVHWSRTQLNTDYINTSGDTMTGTLNGISALFSAISATTYANLPLATTAVQGVIQALNGASNYYFDGTGGWTIIPAGVGGVSGFSGLNDVFPLASKGGYIVVVRPNETGLSAIASSTFATSSQLLDYIPISVSSTFAQTTSLNNYIPTSVSSTFAQSSDLTSHTASAVHWSRTQLNSDYINTSGDTMTGTLNGVSALFNTVSATSYLNVTATVGSATTTAIGGLQLNGLVNTFYNGSGQWVSGVEASSVMHTSGGTFTGSVTGTSAIFNTVSSSRFVGLPIERGVSILTPSANDEITLLAATRPYTISSILGILKGTSPSASVSFYVSSNRTASTSIGTFNFSSTTSFSKTTSVSGNIVSGDMMWLKVNALAGTVTELHTTIELIRSG